MSNKKNRQKTKRTDRLEFVYERGQNLIQVTRNVPNLLGPIDNVISTLQAAKREFPQAIEISLDVDWQHGSSDCGFELIVLRPEDSGESSHRIETQKTKALRLKKLAAREARSAVHLARIQALEKELAALKKAARRKKE